MKQPVIHTFPNGLRAVVNQSEGNVSYIGVLINVGSRDDAPGRDGLAHFVEHTIFKGTPTRKSSYVSNRMELVGGELNAYTTKEEIMLYTNAPAGYEKRALQLLGELISNAWFPKKEIDLERNVIKEEIHSYQDNASYAVFDEFDEELFKDSSLAHNILGYDKTVSSIDTDDCRDFLTRYFTPENMVVYCVSPTSPDNCLQLIDSNLGIIDRPYVKPDRRAPLPRPKFDITADRNNHQANVVTGCPLFSSDDPRRYALYLYSNILGGSAMNSRLNRALRERRGLVYSVETSISLYSDAGVFQIFYATEPEKMAECERIIRKEINNIALYSLTDIAFRQAKTQLCGQLLVSGENKENYAMSLAKSLLRHGEIHDNSYTAARIRDITKAEFKDMAVLIGEADFSRLTIL